MDSELKQLEEELRGFAPSPMSGDVLARMVEAMDRWEQAEGDRDADFSGKVVPFPKEEKRASWRPMWSAAAAVAILGAVMGVMLPDTESPGVTAMNGLGPVPALRQASLVPVNVQRKVRSMDAGMVSNKDGLEYQLIRVVRQEEADFRGGGDVGLKISRPKVDYYVVPVSY